MKQIYAKKNQYNSSNLAISVTEISTDCFFCFLSFFLFTISSSFPGIATAADKHA